jgi:DNA gyrase subunit B
METSDYAAENIEVLEGLEAVRRRPGMYLGDVRDGSALHHMVWEIVGNSIDQHLARRVRHLRVDLDERWVTVEDDGPGIPVEAVLHGRSALDLIFTTLHCGPTWDGHFPHVHLTSSLHGVGVAAVNAVCGRLEVESRRRGTLWRAAFERGRTVSPLEHCGRTSSTGTRVRFRPDPEIFGHSHVDEAKIEARLRELAWLNPLLDVRWQGASLPGRDGLSGYVREIAASELVCEPLCITRLIHDVWVDLAIGWQKHGAPELRTFVNQMATKEGTHITGLWQGFARAFGARVGPVRELIEPGLVAVLHVGLLEPKFGAPTRDQLTTPAARSAVREALRQTLPSVLRSRGELGAFLRQRLTLPA